MLFKIGGHSLSTFFRDYHSDVLHDPRYCGGDVEKMGAEIFDSTARCVWGLKSQGFDHQTYTMAIVDEELFNRCGIRSYGQVVT